MKKTLLLCALAMLGLGGCEKFLEEQPSDFLGTENFYRTEADAVAALNGVFSTLQPQVYYGRTVWLITELPTDLVRVGSATDERGLLSRFNYNSTLSEISNWWTSSYRLINRANDVIEKVPEINMDGARRNNIVGNARFLRAMAYFDLVRCFGAVPLRLKTVRLPEEGAERLGRAPIAEVYAQIIDDLKYAEANCLLETSTNPALAIPGGEKGRVSKGAAQALLAKAYRTRATTSAAQPTDNAEALAACDRLIASGQYSLLTSYGDIFLPDRENGPEHIFSVQFDLPPNTGNIIVRQFLPTQLQGLGSFTVEPAFAASYATADARRAWNIGNVPGSTTNFYFNKFRDDRRAGNDSRANWLVTRYADVLLLRSEILNELDPGGLAKNQSINLVRRRAGLADLPNTPTSKEAFVDLLLRERAWELCIEGHRWYDLVRLNRLLAVRKPANIQPGPVDPKYVLFPIPQSELLLNPNVIQNPGHN